VNRLLVAAVVAAVAAAPAWADAVPDASFAAVADGVVRVELDDHHTIEGRLIDYNAATVSLATTGTNEVVTVQRAHVAKLFLVEEAPRGVAFQLAAPAIEPHRLWGVHFGLPGTLLVDVDYRYWHAFASPNVLLPILTASGEHTWYAAAVGGGVSIHLSRRWKVDAFAEVMPLRYTSFYTYLAGGLGVGVHHTAASGLSVGFSLPVVGFAARLGSSPYGYDAPFRYNDSVGYFYLAGFSTMPLLTIGYRFPCRARG
jgi:hypothetical protein